MPHSSPHPLTLFSLVPDPHDNERAKAVISHPDNAHLTSKRSDGSLALDVGFQIHGNSSTILAILGRGPDADIYIENSKIARIQCTFEINLETGIVMFCDRSFAQSSQVFGDNAQPFEHGRVRQVLVREDLNTIIGMGGERRNLIQFTLLWYQSPKQTANFDKVDSALPYERVVNPRHACTMDEDPTNLPSRRHYPIPPLHNHY